MVAPRLPDEHDPVGVKVGSLRRILPFRWAMMNGTHHRESPTFTDSQILKPTSCEVRSVLAYERADTLDEIEASSERARRGLDRALRDWVGWL